MKKIVDMNKYHADYENTRYDTIAVNLPIECKAPIQEYSRRTGKSVARIFINAIEAYYGIKFEEQDTVGTKLKDKGVSNREYYGISITMPESARDELNKLAELKGVSVNKLLLQGFQKES